MNATRTPAPRTDPASMARRAVVPVLCYHQIRAPTAADSAQDRSYIVAPKVFAAQMAALDRAGYTTVTAERYAAHVARGKPLPRKPVVLTFDDGTAGQYTRVLPVLKRYRFVATFFPMTVVLGKDGWMTRGQVRALDRAGMTIGAHSYDHKAVPEYSGDDWSQQISAPKRDLEKLLGKPVWVFAYPFGLWDSTAFRHIDRAGFVGAFQLADDMDKSRPLQTLRRIIVPAWSGRELLRQMRRAF